MASLHLRVPDDLDEYLSRSARQTRRSKNELAAQMLDEARRSRIFPGIAFRGSDWARRPYLVSCGLDVWEAVAIIRDYEAQRERLMDETVLRSADVALATSYHDRFPEEIDEAISANEHGLTELGRQYPTIATLPLDE